MFNKCHDFFFNKCPGKRVFPLSKLWLRSIKTSPVHGAFPESCHIGRIVTTPGNGAFWEYWLLKPLVFTANMTVRLLVYEATAELGAGAWEQDKLKHDKAYNSYQDSAVFPWINVLQIDASPWLIPRVLKKLILTIFCQCSYCFYGGYFQKSLLWPIQNCFHM